MDEKFIAADLFKIPQLPNENSAFKKPVLPIPKLAKETEEENNSSVKKDGESVDDKDKKVKAKKVEKTSVPLPYQEPDWSGHPTAGYSLEIIKNGTFISTLPIKSSLVVFGRLDICDIVFEHPSVSRYHAIIQFCRGDNEHPKGFYLYDLGSTHGTFLNKEKIKSKVYYKLKVGYILKFGGSSRLHIFQGPEEEEEEKNDTNKESLTKQFDKDEGCSWGMDDDDEVEDIMSENPFALSHLNEELYIDDPKKTLRNWFEREGYELEYDVEEKGFRTFSCTIRLPIDTADGEFLPVEASVNGKKKEAVIACALEACRTLDRMGLLRQSQKESQQKKRKKWEENDYYDSDEDTFYDRTGDIEKRREMRKRLAKKVEVDNFESISVKLQILNAEMEDIKKKILSSDKNSQSSVPKESDPLDSYMSELSGSCSTISDKFERRKLKLRLIELEKEKARLEKLSDIAKPTSLPPISKYSHLIGKKPKSKLQLASVKVDEVAKTTKNDQIEENDSDDNEDSVMVDSSSSVNSKESETNKYGLILNPSSKSETPASKIESDQNTSMETSSEEICALQNIGKPILENKPSDVQEESLTDTTKTKLLPLLDDVQAPVNSASSKSTKSPVFPKVEGIPSSQSSDSPSKSTKSSKRDEKLKGKKIDVYKSNPTEYCTWLPPENQSGDGRTHLNDKYGY